MPTPPFSRASGFGPLFAIVEGELGAEALASLRSQSGFVLTDYSPTTLLPFPLMNRVYNLAATLIGDRQFGARVGLTIRPNDFGPFAEYALRGETLGDVIARANHTQPLHSTDTFLDLSVIGAQARWRLRYRSHAEPTVEQHAQRTLMQMLGSVRRYPGHGPAEIAICVAEPYAEEARLLEKRLDVRVWPRTDDYELVFPASWLGHWTPIEGLPTDTQSEVFACYQGRPLPRSTSQAVFAALELHDDLSGTQIGKSASDLGLPARTLQNRLRQEGASYRDIVCALRMKRARQLLEGTSVSLAEVALRAGYSDPANFHRAFVSSCGMTPGRFREASRA